MVNETLETETLETLAEKIARCATEADDQTIEAAKLIRAARSRIENGEAGEVTWYEWARKNIELSMSRLRELQRIAKADDPRKELERIREKTQERVERHREKKKSAPLRNGGGTAKVTTKPKDDRQRLIEWTRSAPLIHVEKALTYVQRFDSTAAVANPDESAEPAVM